MLETFSGQLAYCSDREEEKLVWQQQHGTCICRHSLKVFLYAWLLLIGDTHRLISFKRKRLSLQ